MLWYEITSKHHQRLASVSAKSTPASPATGEGPFIGRISCPIDNCVPVLIVTEKEIHHFARWWEVELLEE